MSPQAPEPSCPQCGGPVAVAEGQLYARCRYCSAESFVDLTGAILHEVIRPTVGRARVPGLIKARAAEAGWRDVSLASLQLTYEPVWELEGTDGRRVAVSARAGLEGRFNLVTLPGGERIFVDEKASGSVEMLEPELAPESVPEVAARESDRPTIPKRLRLIHRPVYSGQVRIAGRTTEFQLDGATGELFDIDWPVETSYRKRNIVWGASAAMVILATLLPLALAAAAVVAIGAGAITTVRRGRDPTRVISP
jgi:hypothetical protein